MQKEELLFQKRLIELSNTAYQRGIPTFTDFLNLNELNILHIIPKNQLFTAYRIFGGYELSERQIVAFIPDAFSGEINYPIKILKISPLNTKFSEPITHRDYLGAILNLGIERNKIGDILVNENEAVIFVNNAMHIFIKSELTRIKHTTIKTTTSDSGEFQVSPKYEEIKGSVTSIRLDSLLSLAYSSSRSKLVTLIESGKVFVNGRLITTNSYQLKVEDIISVRGIGKFSYKGIVSTTKKGRYYVMLCKYI
ncbi:MAG: YlmH/Sll1252 family protein [Lachnospiraceae bacterium]|nr:YlmH/Sll1252 family protein [Lachnospiraceae bacterium]